MGSQQMVKYIGKKLISVVLMLLIVSAFTFSLTASAVFLRAQLDAAFL